MAEQQRKLRILQVNKFYHPYIGGIESVVRMLSREMLDRAEVQVLVCQKNGKTKREIVEGVPVTRAGTIGTYFSCPLSFSFFRYFRKMAKQADVVEIHTPFPLADAACLLSGFRGRVVIAWHSDVVKQKKLLKLYRPLLMRFLKRADQIIVATKGHIDGSAFLPAFREKCRIIPYGIRVESYLQAACTPILTEQLRKPGRVKVLFVGRLVYYKGVDVLLEAFRAVQGAELFLVGNGSLEDDLRQQAQAEPLQETVHFMGTLSDADLKSAFSDCDLFVLPSVATSEAFGIVQLEAMVYQKPVINTNLASGVPYVSLDGETGLTVPVKDAPALAAAIQKLVDDPALRAQYGAAAQKRVLEQFQESNVVDAVYQTLAEGIDRTGKVESIA